jgi:hypothetical protein
MRNERSLLALGILLFCTSAFAQTSGTISGFARDPSGAVVPDARVQVVNQGTGAVRTTASDESGFYQVLGLVSGQYTIEAEATGFRRYRNTGVSLSVDQNVRSDITLEIGQVTEAVEVSAQATLIDTRSSQASTVIDDRRIIDLPLGNRNVFGLAKTIPGVLNVSAPDNTNVTNSRGGPVMNVHGGRANMNYNTFNGAYFMNPSRNTGLNVPPPDAVQEVKIQTSNFTADSGRNPGANLTIVSRQGTNEIHGSVWEFHRNDNLNARSFFEAVKPQLIRNQYGAAAGGPILKNKLFVFGTLEMNTDRTQPTVTATTPPSTAEMNGDFSHLTSKRLVNPFDGQPFPNNRIPTALFDPVSKKLLEFVTTVPVTGQTLQTLGARPRDSKLYMLRVDYNLANKHNLFVTYYLNQTTDGFEGVGAFGTPFAGWTGQENFNRVQTASVNNVSTLSSTLLNQLTLGFTRSFSPSGPTVTRTPDSLGIQGMPVYTNGGSPIFGVTGRWSLSSGSVTKFISNTYQIKNDLNLIRGRHTVKFGGEFMDIGWFQSFLGPPSFTFNGARTGGGSGPAGDALADFLLGAYSNLSVSAGVRHNDDHTKFMSFYIQDDFKATSRLTLNLGLRWELPWPWVEKFDRLNTVWTDAGIRSSQFPQAPPGMLFPGDNLPGGGTMPRGLVNRDNNNFAPRLGLAWDIFGDGRTALRAAYGLFYETANGDTLAQTNPPFVVGSENYRDGRLANPFGSINAVPLPVVADPREIRFVLPMGGLWGPQTTDFATPYVQNWSTFIDRQLSDSYALTLGYIGKKGHNLLAFRPFNAALFIPGTNAQGQPLSTRANINQRVPFLPGVYNAAGYFLDNAFRNNYHALQLELKKRFSHGFQFETSYVLSKSLDNSSTHTLGGSLTDPYRPDHDYGRSTWDRRHAYVVSGVWAPPIFTGQRGVAGALLGGWTLTGITTIYSGGPLSFAAGEDTGMNGAGGARADIVGDPKRSHSSRDDMIAKFFNTAAFVRPQDGTVGSSGRSILSGPAQVSTDLAVLKDFRVYEQARFQLRVETFNVFNQVNFGDPRTTLTDSRFGQITGSGSGRNLLVGLKFMW